MTRKERIDWLCRLRSWVVAPPRMTAEQMSKFVEALTETIKDLQTEPCEDTISRQNVIETIKELRVYVYNNLPEMINRAALINVVEKLPSVQPERR